MWPLYCACAKQAYCRQTDEYNAYARSRAHVDVPSNLNTDFVATRARMVKKLMRLQVIILQKVYDWLDPNQKKQY